MLTRRRALMASSQEGDEEMREWKTLIEETLIEDKNISLSGFDCKEVEAYIIAEDKKYEAGNIYLTSVKGGTIYGDPRAVTASRNTQFIAFLRLEVITPYLWSGEGLVSQYYTLGNPVSSLKGFGHSYANVVLNKESITELSVAMQGNLKAGTKIYVRGR